MKTTITEEQVSNICMAFHKWMRVADGEGTANVYNGIHELPEGYYHMAMSDALKEAGFKITKSLRKNL